MAQSAQTNPIVPNVSILSNYNQLHCILDSLTNEELDKLKSEIDEEKQFRKFGREKMIELKTEIRAEREKMKQSIIDEREKILNKMKNLQDCVEEDDDEDEVIEPPKKKILKKKLRKN